MFRVKTASDGGVVQHEAVVPVHDPPAAMTSYARVVNIIRFCLSAATPLLAGGFFLLFGTQKILKLMRIEQSALRLYKTRTFEWVR